MLHHRINLFNVIHLQVYTYTYTHSLQSVCEEDEWKALFNLFKTYTNIEYVWGNFIGKDNLALSMKYVSEYIYFPIPILILTITNANNSGNNINNNNNENNSRSCCNNPGLTN